jgi:hypothetical protein
MPRRYWISCERFDRSVLPTTLQHSNTPRGRIRGQGRVRAPSSFFENLVVLKTELRRNLRKWLGFQRDSLPQRANRTELTVLAQCSAANLARAFAFCFHDWGAGLAPGILVDLVADRLQKVACGCGLCTESTRPTTASRQPHGTREYRVERH